MPAFALPELLEVSTTARRSFFPTNKTAPCRRTSLSRSSRSLLRKVDRRRSTEAQGAGVACMLLLLLLLLRFGETTYLTNSFQKEIWFVTFGLDALKKVLILLRHITTESAFKIPLPPKKRKKGRKFLSLFDKDRKQDMKAQFTWAARSQ